MFFASDNAGPVHPSVMEALAAGNAGYAPSYGADQTMAEVTARLREIFEAPEAAVYLVPTGTAANALALATLSDPWQTIFCSSVAHIHEDECNAPEFYSGGAKLTLVALGCTAAEMTWKAGVDAVSFGGTKNGLMGVEAVIFFDPSKAWEFELRRKRGAHLFSKHRYLSLQMRAYLQGDLWIASARKANDNAAYLAEGLRQIEGTSFVYEPQANMIFCAFSRAAHQRLHDAGAAYYVWSGSLEGADPQEALEARLVCDWAIERAQIDAFLDILRG